MRIAILIFGLGVTGCVVKEVHTETPQTSLLFDGKAMPASTEADAYFANLRNEPPVPPVPAPTPVAASAKASAASTPTSLDRIGGEEKLPVLSRQIARALTNDRVLARSRLTTVGRARLEAFIKQQLCTLVGTPVDGEMIDQDEILWEVRPGHAEFEAASAAIDTVLVKNGVDESTRAIVDDALFGDESSQAPDITRMVALFRRAAVGLSCNEGQISSRPLESADHRIVTGCGRTAIYDYSPDGAPLQWRREPAP
jgi:hypothetical protein